MTRTKKLFGAGWLLLLAGCAYLPITSVPDTTFAPGEAVEPKMAAYYRNHGVEYKVGACNRPYFDAITRVEVLEDTTERLVIEIRYAYRDRLRDDENTRGRKPRPSSRKLCNGFESRQFAFGKDDGGEISVTEMTGERRGAAGSRNSVTLGGSSSVGTGSN
ncbi:MAG: hypothetical protein ACR2QJ_12230 [Geminicoccaceae bacterium]